MASSLCEGAFVISDDRGCKYHFSATKRKMCEDVRSTIRDKQVSWRSSAGIEELGSVHKSYEKFISQEYKFKYNTYN